LYKYLFSPTVGSSRHIWAAYELIQERDDQIASAFNDPQRSVAVPQLALMMSLSLISWEELQSFTPHTQSIVDALRRPMRMPRAIKSTSPRGKQAAVG
jgi:hypothetical protein